MQKQLEYSLSLVIDWLKFAEGKNATLVAANGAAIFGVLKVFEGHLLPATLSSLFLYQALFFLFLSACFCLVSFVPQVNVPWLTSRTNNNKKANLLAYADIANYTPQQYLEAMCEKASVPVTDTTAIDKDLAELVVLYSRIAIRKYSLFNLGLWCFLSSIVTPVVALAIYAVRKGYIKE